MPLLSVVPDLISEASGDLTNIGSTLHSTVSAAANQTTAIAAPASDEVSAAITALFASHAHEFQTMNAQATSFHAQFVNLLNGGAAQYLNTEVANAEQTAINAVNTPAQALLGHPLIARGVGQSAAGGVHAAAQADTGTSNSTTTVTHNYGPITVTATSSPNSSTYNEYIATPLGNLSLLSASYYVSPNTIGPPDAPLTPFDGNLSFMNGGFGWTLSGLPIDSNTFEYSFYATNFWATAQGFYLTQPISGSGPVMASILESYGPLGLTGFSFISPSSNSPFVPWIVFNGSPLFEL
jgi:hypothetical protein